MGKDDRSLRFLVDAMLGNLVSWLRILGYDTLYWDGDDDKLVERAIRENRIILTKDRELYTYAKRTGLEAFLVNENDVKDILSEISKNYRVCLDFDPKQTRCPICNGELKMNEIGSGKQWTCIVCGKHYWIGSHFRNISKTLEEAKKRTQSIR
ncbi:MAG: Mut7-C RNAse domain-containing protein [Candidatus Caldarchaeales archaeon]